MMQKCVRGAVRDVDDGISGLGALVGDGDLGGVVVRLLLVVANRRMTKWMKKWISTQRKNLR